MDTPWIRGILVYSLITLLISYSNGKSVNFEVNFDLT